jgi:hypothetical protein
MGIKTLRGFDSPPYKRAREVMDEKPFEHIGHYGTTLVAQRCDFKGGVVITRPKDITNEQCASDIIEIAAWHAIHIHPHLSGFSGYDNIEIALKRAAR